MNNPLMSFLKTSSLFLLSTTAIASFNSPAFAIRFTGAFAPSEFTLSNSNADGSVDDSGAGSGMIVLSGGNNGNPSFSSGTTTWITTTPIAEGGTISFNWSFTGDGFIYDGSSGDRAGYFISGSPTTYLAFQDTDSGSVASLSLSAGQTFGFIVDTADNNGSPGAFTVSNFEFNATPTPVPFEFEGSAGILTLGAIWGVNQWRKNRIKK